MDLIWILTGGGVDGYDGVIKHYNLIEFDVLERHIKLSDISKRVYCYNSEIINDGFKEKIKEKIRNKIETGISFLCKNEIYNNNKKYYNFGYYIINLEGNLEIKPIRHGSEIIYNQFINLLIDNCVYNN
jgi:hypothetical protein